MELRARSFVAIAVVLAGVASARADDNPAPAADDEALALLPEVPALDSDAAGCPPFYAEGIIQGQDSAIKVRVWCRGKGDLACRIVDGQDGTTYMASSGRNVMVYDPLRPAALCASDMSPILQFSSEKRQLQFRAGISTQAGSHPRVELDLRSLVSDPSITLRVDQLTDQRFQMTCTSPTGNQLVVNGERGPARPSASVVLNMADGSPSPFRITVASLTEDADDDFEFPAVETIRSKLPVEAIDSNSGPLKQLELVALIVRAFGVHAAVRSPELRRTPGFDLIDWTAVEQNDARHAPLLRDLFRRKNGVRQAAGDSPRPE